MSEWFIEWKFNINLCKNKIIHNNKNEKKEWDRKDKTVEYLGDSVKSHIEKIS